MRSELRPVRRRLRRGIHVSLALTAGVALGLSGTAAAVAATAPDGPGAPPTAGVFAASPAAIGVPALTSIASEADGQLDEARSALTEAFALAREASDSGLDLSPGGAAIETKPLEDALARLTATEVVPVLLLPAMTDETAEAARQVRARTSDVREALEAARAQQAAEEAAAEAQRQAEAAAAAEAQRQAERAAELAAVNTPAGAKTVAARMASERYGWGSEQFSCLSSLWEKESSWNYQAYNASSGATGIPQALPGSKMASAGSDWATNAATQISWGLQYISAAYGTPCGAWGTSQSSGWY